MPLTEELVVFILKTAPIVMGYLLLFLGAVLLCYLSFGAVRRKIRNLMKRHKEKQKRR